MDQASPLAAKLQTDLLLPLIYPLIHDGQFKSRFLQKRLAKRAEEIGDYVKAFANADTIVFDKTGTLTHATPTVVKVVPFGTRTEDEILQIAACLEEHYPHSSARP